MADDVKVKFGGDFTGVAAGATSAAQKAGTALGDWFTDFRRSMAMQIATGLALTALVGKFVQSASESLQYFREMDLTMRRLGSTGAEFQKLARFGKDVGVSMENVSRTLNYYNLYSRKASEGNVTHARTLEMLGFKQSEVKAGTADMTEALMKLADLYDSSGNETIIAAKAMEIFGIRGKELIPIIKAGRQQITDMTRDMKVLSATAIKELSTTQLRIERAKQTLERVFVQNPLEAYGKYLANREGSQLFYEAFSERGAGGGTVEQQARSQAASITSNASDVAAIKSARDTARNTAQTTFGSESRFSTLLADRLDQIIKKREETPATAAVITPLLKAAALSASSLQEIGGGDVSSVLSGTYNNDMLEVARQTAENTARIAAKDDTPRPTLSVTK